MGRIDLAPIRSGLACDSVAAPAATRGIVIAEDEGRGRLAAMGLRGHTAFLHRMSLSALDKAGNGRSSGESLWS